MKVCLARVKMFSYLLDLVLCGCCTQTSWKKPGQPRGFILLKQCLHPSQRLKTMLWLVGGKPILCSNVQRRAIWKCWFPQNICDALACSGNPFHLVLQLEVMAFDAKLILVIGIVGGIGNDFLCSGSNVEENLARMLHQVVLS